MQHRKTDINICNILTQLKTNFVLIMDINVHAFSFTGYYVLLFLFIPLNWGYSACMYSKCMLYILYKVHVHVEQTFSISVRYMYNIGALKSWGRGYLSISMQMYLSSVGKQFKIQYHHHGSNSQSWFKFSPGLKCICHQKIFIDMWKGHILEVHCTNIQRKRFIK